MRSFGIRPSRPYNACGKLKLETNIKVEVKGLKKITKLGKNQKQRTSDLESECVKSA